MPTHEALGARIRRRRDELGLSQSKLAARLPGSVDLNYVSRWERGIHRPNESVLPHLARALEVDVGYLQEAITPPAPARLSQLDRIELILDAIADQLGLEVDMIMRAAAPSLEVFEGLGETAGPAAQPPARTPAREDEQPAPGRTRPRRAGNEPS